MLADFLEMADYLITEGYKDPATVVAGSGLESHLRKMCAEGAASPAPEEKMKQWKYPVGWDEKRVRRVLEHYEAQSASIPAVRRSRCSLRP